jgi:hypothetical protein
MLPTAQMRQAKLAATVDWMRSPNRGTHARHAAAARTAS